MRLKEIFDYLGREHLDKHLRSWFKKAYSTIEGKIISLHYAKELDLECWNCSKFGYYFSKEFAFFLKSKMPSGDPVKLANDFCISNQNFQFFGTGSKSFGTIVSVIRMEHIIRAIGDRGARYLNCLTSDNKKCQEIKRLLKKHEISIANEGIVWLTIFEKGLYKIDYAKNACDLLGKRYNPNHYYLILETKQNNHLFRPTISEGEFKMQFRPYCDTLGWGLTLTTSSFEEGVPEAIKKDTKEIVGLRKYLLPSKSRIIKKKRLLRIYFENEKEKFKKDNKIAFNDLINAWK